MVKEPNHEQNNDTPLDKMNEQDLVVKLLHEITREDVSRDKLQEIVEYALKILSQ